MRRRNIWAGLAAAVVAIGATAACSPSDVIAVGADTVVVDVRTPEEYATGHLDGAVNLNVEAGDFADRVAQLDHDGQYVVYCRSGNRASVAAGLMEDLGFSDVTNAGGITDAAAATGLDVVH